MKNSVHIEFAEVRDFSRRMTVTFDFLRQNFKGLFKSMLMIAGPSLLLGSLLFADFFSSFGAAATGEEEQLVNYFTSVWFVSKLIIGIIAILLSYLFSYLVVVGYVHCYRTKGTSLITVEEVWAEVRKRLFGFIGLGIVMTIIGGIGYVLMLVLAFGLGAVSPILSMLFFIAAFVGVFYVLVKFSMVFYVFGFEGSGLVVAIKRSFYLTEGKFWSTLGTLFVSSILASILSYVVLIPFYIVFIVQLLHNTGNPEEMRGGLFSFVGIMYGVLAFTSTLLQAIPILALTFQYYNLRERKEASGLLKAIDGFGNAGVRPAEIDSTESY